LYQYKDEHNFLSGQGFCYVPEFSKKQYRQIDFLRLVKGDDEEAHRLFQLCEWQHPESILETCYQPAKNKPFLKHKFVYGEPLVIHFNDNRSPLVPAHFMECYEKEEDRASYVYVVNWEGNIIQIDSEQIADIERLDIKRFCGITGIIPTNNKKEWT